jgi:hypothetical protein
MVRFRLVAVAVLSMTMAPAFAEDIAAPAPPTDNSICWLGGLAFSPGAVMRTGFDTSICRSDGTWSKTTASGPAGCLKNGQLFGIGSSDESVGAKSGKQTCQKNGTWA